MRQSGASLAANEKKRVQEKENRKKRTKDQVEIFIF